LSTFGWFSPSYNNSLLLIILPEADEKNKVLKKIITGSMQGIFML
jgi:hypothetical protein